MRRASRKRAARAAARIAQATVAAAALGAKAARPADGASRCACAPCAACAPGRRRARRRRLDRPPCLSGPGAFPARVACVRARRAPELSVTGAGDAMVACTAPARPPSRLWRAGSAPIGRASSEKSERRRLRRGAHRVRAGRSTRAACLAGVGGNLRAKAKARRRRSVTSLSPPRAADSRSRTARHAPRRLQRGVACAASRRAQLSRRKRSTA